MMCFALSGQVQAYLGWTGFYYLPGIFCSIGCLGAAIFYTETPAESCWIGDTEMEAVQQGHWPKENEKGKDKRRPKKRAYLDRIQLKAKTPWKKILLSLPVWSTIVATVASEWSYEANMVFTQSYLQYVLEYSLASGLTTNSHSVLFCLLSIKSHCQCLVDLPVGQIHKSSLLIEEDIVL